MNPGKFAVVFRYEFRKMVLTKAFLLTTLLGPFFLVAVAVLPSLLAAKSMDRTGSALNIGLLTEAPGTETAASRYLVPLIAERGWIPRISAEEAPLRAGVLEGTLDGYLRVPSGFPGEPAPSGSAPALAWYTKSSTDMFVFEAVASMVSQALISERVRVAGVDEDWARALLAPAEVPVIRVSAGEGDRETGGEDFLVALVTGLVFCMVVYMTVLLYGQQTGRSVVAEKSSKIVDILLSSAPAEDILFGKLLGIGLAGMLQYAVWIAMTGGALALAKPLLNLELPIALGADKYLWLVVFFALGYLLYAAFYAAFGAASEDDQHMAQLSMPVVFILVVPMVMVQSFVQRPDSFLAVVFSYVPFTSPMVMLVRLLAGSASPLEAILSAGILCLSIAASVFLAAKVFRTGLLMTGKNFGFKDIAAWLKA